VLKPKGAPKVRSFLWAKIIGGGFRDSAQSDLDRLVELVEQEP